MPMAARPMRRRPRSWMQQLEPSWRRNPGSNLKKSSASTRTSRKRMGTLLSASDWISHLTTSLLLYPSTIHTTTTTSSSLRPVRRLPTAHLYYYCALLLAGYATTDWLHYYCGYLCLCVMLPLASLSMLLLLCLPCDYTGYCLALCQ